MADPSGGGEMSMREYRKGNWTVGETLVLIEAKKMDEERRVRRSMGLPPLQIKKPEILNRRAPELRWKWIEEYCWRKGCVRSQNQCNDKWDNLMRDYKKIRAYESWRVESSSNTGSSSSAAAASSYWNMDKSERKERNLPSNMLPQIYRVLVELVEKKSLHSSSYAATTVSVGNGNGGYSGGQILTVCPQSLRFVVPMMAQPMHQTTATNELPLPPPPPPQYLVLSHPPPPQLPPSTFHAEPIQPTVELRLPQRLFATNRYPSNRLNVYSRPDLLTFLTQNLKGTEEFEIIRKSTFGGLSNLLATRCSMSGKLVHSLLSRQLVTKNKYTLYTTFGGHPLRFSLKELGEVTGLNCCEFPDEIEPDHNPPNPVPPDSY